MRGRQASLAFPECWTTQLEEGFGIPDIQKGGVAKVEPKAAVEAEPGDASRVEANGGQAREQGICRKDSHCLCKTPV